MSGTHEKIAILDFGSQYTQLIARRIRELGVYSEILRHDAELPRSDTRLKGVILSGGPDSVYDADAVNDLRVIADITAQALAAFALRQIDNIVDDLKNGADVLSKRAQGINRLKRVFCWPPCLL